MPDPSARFLRARTTAPGSWTAHLTATSSTMLPSDTTQRTPHTHIARSDQGSACIC
jgi:hypothetical protein